MPFATDAICRCSFYKISKSQESYIAEGGLKQSWRRINSKSFIAGGGLVGKVT